MWLLYPEAGHAHRAADKEWISEALPVSTIWRGREVTCTATRRRAEDSDAGGEAWGDQQRHVVSFESNQSDRRGYVDWRSLIHTGKFFLLCSHASSQYTRLVFCSALVKRFQLVLKHLSVLDCFYYMAYQRFGLLLLVKYIDTGSRKLSVFCNWIVKWVLPVGCIKYTVVSNPLLYSLVEEDNKKRDVLSFNFISSY